MREIGMKHVCIEKALSYMEENLTSRINLEDIADAANLSQWYFHRLFKVLTGYCVNDYLSKRRLCEASHELLYTSKSIGEIARNYQFGSQEAFTRSFSSLAGLSPGRFRRQLAPLLRYPAISLDKSYKHLRKGVKNMNPRFEQKASFKVIGVQYRALASESLHKLWGEYSARCEEIPHVCEKDKAYQVCLFEGSNPEKEEYTFIAGMCVDNLAEIPSGMLGHVVKAAQYAIFEHRGKLDKLHQTYQYIFGVWLQENAWIMDEADALEIYDSRFIPESDDSLLEIWIPIKKA